MLRATWLYLLSQSSCLPSRISILSRSSPFLFDVSFLCLISVFVVAVWGLSWISFMDLIIYLSNSATVKKTIKNLCSSVIAKWFYPTLDTMYSCCTAVAQLCWWLQSYLGCRPSSSFLSSSAKLPAVWYPRSPASKCQQLSQSFIKMLKPFKVFYPYSTNIPSLSVVKLAAYDSTFLETIWG